MSPSGGILDGAASRHVIDKLFQCCDWPECKQSGSLPARLSPHSFRVAINTDLLDHGVPLEDVQHLAGYAALRLPATEGDAEHRREDFDLAI